LVKTRTDMAIRSVVQSIVRPVGIKVVHSFISGKEAASPLNLVNSGPCQFWFDGQDSATLSLNGNKVIQWDDKSGFDRHVSNAVDAQRPTYDPATGRLTFTNVANTYLNLLDFDAPLAQPNTFYILYSITLPQVGPRYILAGGRNNNEFNALYYNGTVFTAITVPILLTAISNANDNIHTLEVNGANSNYWINGILEANGNLGVQTHDGLTFGNWPDGGFGLNAEIMEIFGYNCLLTETERTKLNAYLTKKWGL